MKNVAVALYAEGPTDQRFLPEVIRRTAKQNLNHVPAYQRFVQDLVKAFRTINLID